MPRTRWHQILESKVAVLGLWLLIAEHFLLEVLSGLQIFEDSQVLEIKVLLQVEEAGSLSFAIEVFGALQGDQVHQLIVSHSVSPRVVGWVVVQVHEVSISVQVLEIESSSFSHITDLLLLMPDVLMLPSILGSRLLIKTP